MPPAKHGPARSADPAVGTAGGGTDIRIESAASAAASRLIAELDRELATRYPGAPANGIDAATFEETGGVFAIAWREGKALACGAFRRFEDKAEIKRMYVRPASRGQGLSRLMLAFLEREAAKAGYTEAVLETGTAQPEAIGLYQSAGWLPAEPFGPYVGDPDSVFFRKRLAG